MVWAWANDPETRRWSFRSQPIDWDVHERWFAAVLARDDRRLWIAEDDGGPVGQIRLDSHGSGWFLSLALAPDRRGRGLATPLIRAGTGTVGPDQVVRANVKPDNERSRRAFLAAGYGVEVEQPDRVVFRHPLPEPR
jgi:RimJ/RimL family protein N-acetyltransferase